MNRTILLRKQYDHGIKGAVVQYGDKVFACVWKEGEPGFRDVRLLESHAAPQPSNVFWNESRHRFELWS